jgi:uncharacterized membrane protein
MGLAEFRWSVEIIGFGFEALGVIVIASGTIIAVMRTVATGISNLPPRYRELRHELGSAIVLGLEFLVAGDIIRTVAVDPSLQSVTVLGIIVLIRTFLSMTLQLEIDGCWPWQRGAQSNHASIAAKTTRPERDANRQ